MRDSSSKALSAKARVAILLVAVLAFALAAMAGCAGGPPIHRDKPFPTPGSPAPRVDKADEASEKPQRKRPKKLRKAKKQSKRFPMKKTSRAHFRRKIAVPPWQSRSSCAREFTGIKRVQRLQRRANGLSFLHPVSLREKCAGESFVPAH